MKSLLVDLQKDLKQDQEKKTKINKNQIKHKQIKPKLKPKQPLKTKKQRKPFRKKKAMLTYTK